MATSAATEAHERNWRIARRTAIVTGAGIDFRWRSAFRRQDDKTKMRREMESNQIKELHKAIDKFEQILQMLPNDRTALEFLCIAYEQLGDIENYRRVLVAQAQVLIDERDFESARNLLANLEKHNEPGVNATALKIRAMLSPASAAQTGATTSSATAPANEPKPFENAAVAIEMEITLMKWLEANKIVEKELSAKVCEQLRAMATANGDFLISALAVLESENQSVAEVAAARIVDETKTPPVALEAFDQVALLAKEFPAWLVKVRGAVPFGKIADDLLVALANPMDEDLKMAIVSQFGGKCHFFLAPPSSLSVVMGKLFPEK